MTDKVTVTYQGFGEVVEETIENPEHIKVLLNIGQVAIDGDVYTNVTEVTYDE